MDNSPSPTFLQARWFGYLVAVAAAAGCTFAGVLMQPRFDIVNIAMVYLLAVVAAADGEVFIPEQIEAVLETHGLALVVQFPDGGTHLVGAVSPAERTLWEHVMAHAGGAVDELASAVGLVGDEVLPLLDALVRRRLLRRDADGFAPLGSAA